MGRVDIKMGRMGMWDRYGMNIELVYRSSIGVGVLLLWKE